MKMTEAEWASIVECLVSGGLRERIDEMLVARCFNGPAISTVNFSMIRQAYDDGNGGNITLSPSETPGYFIGSWEDHVVYEGIEIDGTLYSITPHSGGGGVAVLVGAELTDNAEGVSFHSTAEAKAYIKGFAAK